MPSQRQIERFTLVFHTEALRKLREAPELRKQALADLDRREEQGATRHALSYRERRRKLLLSYAAVLESAVCVDTDDAATLRSMSPLGFVLPLQRRQQLRMEAMSS
jgi:hypothetical protein